VQLVERVIAAMRQAGVVRLLHMSALGANLDGTSMYSRSKAAGEALVRASALDWTIFQPSVVFGPDDHFLNTFAGLAHWFPIIPLAGSSARLQPVYVIDVAAAFVAALARPDCVGQSLVLVGPRIYTLKELVQFAGLAAIGKLRPVLPLPMALGKLQAMMFEMLPGEPLISRDNLDSLKVDNISGDDGLEALGITAHSMEPIAAQYLAGRNPRTRYDRLRVGAGR
jgi:NADH dehydrogenase